MSDPYSYGFKPEFASPSASNLYPSINPSFSQTNQFQNIEQNELCHLNLAMPLSHLPNNAQNKIPAAYQWVNIASTFGQVPPTAVRGGSDQDGAAIYVGRAYHEGDWLPAKVIPDKQAAYVCYGGEEHLMSQYEILCEQRLVWLPAAGGQVPPGAIQAGHTSEHEPLFIGRVYHEGSQTVGKVHPSHGCCYIPFGGQEISSPTYEVLSTSF